MQPVGFCSEKLTLKSVAVYRHVSTQLVKVVLTFYCNRPLKRHIAKLCGVVTRIKFPGYSRDFLRLEILLAMSVLLPRVSNDGKLCQLCFEFCVTPVL